MAQAFGDVQVLTHLRTLFGIKSRKMVGCTWLWKLGGWGTESSRLVVACALILVAAENTKPGAFVLTGGALRALKTHSPARTLIATRVDMSRGACMVRVREEHV